VGVVYLWETSGLTSPTFPWNMDPVRQAVPKLLNLQWMTFLEKSGAIHHLFPHLLFLTDQMTKDEVFALLHLACTDFTGRT